MHGYIHSTFLTFYLVRPGEGHHEELPLDVAPAVEEGEDSKEEEHVSPLHQEVVGVEGAQEQRGDEAEHQQVEGEPGDQGHPPPVAEAVTGEAGEDKFITDIKILFTYKYSNIFKAPTAVVPIFLRFTVYLSWEEMNCRVSNHHLIFT